MGLFSALLMLSLVRGRAGGDSGNRFLRGSVCTMRTVIVQRVRPTMRAYGNKKAVGVFPKATSYR